MSDPSSFQKEAVWVADTGLFIACGRQRNNKYVALRQFAQHKSISLVIPRRVYEELGGAPDRSTPGQTPIDSAIDTGWVTVADDLDYTDSTVASVMDDVRASIARKSNRDEDRVEKADTALAGVAAQLLERGDIFFVTVVTTDRDAGEGVVRALEAHGFDGRIEFKDGFELIEEIT
jgi:hypothetical protein